MITITRYMVPGKGYWALQCPECYGVIKFHVAMSPYCPHCKEIVEPFHHLVDEEPDFAEEFKQIYYETGEVY